MDPKKSALDVEDTEDLYKIINSYIDKVAESAKRERGANVELTLATVSTLNIAIIQLQERRRQHADGLTIHKAMVAAQERQAAALERIADALARALPLASE